MAVSEFALKATGKNDFTFVNIVTPKPRFYNIIKTSL